LGYLDQKAARKEIKATCHIIKLTCAVIKDRAASRNEKYLLLYVELKHSWGERGYCILLHNARKKWYSMVQAGTVVTR